MGINQKLIVCRGLPGSGKSTWALEESKRRPKDVIRVNRDDIRSMFGQYWVPSREKLVTKIENACILQGLQEGYDVIVDATNLGSLDRFANLTLMLTDVNDEESGECPIDIEVKDFTDVPLEVCIERDSKRSMSVGKDVIMRMYNEHLKDKTENGTRREN